MAGRGRGRGFVLPAWKTNPKHLNENGAAATPAPAVAGVPPPVQAAPAQVAGANPAITHLQPLQSLQPPGSLPPPPPRVLGPWAEHTAPDGKTYYFNSLTQESTYEKPDVFKTNAERALPKCVWKEYIKNGKSYFFNSQTNESVWEEPMEFTHYKARLSALCTGEVPTKDTASLEIHDAAKKALEECVVDSDGSGAKRKLEEEKAKEEVEKSKTRVKSAEELELQVVSGDLKAPTQKKKSAPKFSNDAEAIEAFKQLLNDRKVPAKATWMEAMGFGIANDPRFKALKSLKKKKKALEDYAIWKQDKEQAGMKETKAKQRQALKDLLELCAKGEEKKPKITGRMRLSDVTDILELEPAYKDYVDKEERDDLVKRFLDDLYVQQKKEAARKRRALFKEATVALEELVEKKELSVKQSWGEEVSSLLKKSSDERIKAVEPVDLPELWKSFVAEYKERERRRRSEKEKERKEKTKRATLDLYEWILAAVRKGKMSLELRREPLEEALKDQKDFLTLCEYDAKHKAEDEYRAAVRKVQREVEPCRKSLKKLLKKAKVKIVEEIPWNEFLSKHGAVEVEGKEGQRGPLKDKINVLADEFGLGSLQAAFGIITADYKKRYERKKKDFEELLWDFIYKSEHVGMTWEMAKGKICNEEEYLALPSDEVRIEIFKQYMVKFNARKEKKRLALKRKLNPGSGPAEDGEIMDEEKPPEKRKRSGTEDAGEETKAKEAK